MQETTFKTELSKRGFPVMWESGGGASNTGHAQLIAGKNFEPKTPIYIKYKGHLSNSEHALFTVNVDDIVGEFRHHNNDWTITVFRITEINLKTTTMVIINEFNNGEWLNEDNDPDFINFINAGKRKATIYHCRGVVFFKPSEVI